MIFRLSPHASKERLERLTYLTTEVGLGDKIVCEAPGQSYDRYEALTNSGVVLILSMEQLVITGYVASINKATALWKTRFGDESNLPNWLYRRVVANAPKAKQTQEIDREFGYHPRKVAKTAKSY